MYDLTQPGPLAEGQPQQPSIIDKVLGRVYPAGPFGALLSPDALADERRMAFRRAGLSLMAGAGPRALDAPPHNFGADLAQALDPEGWDQHLASVAQMGMHLSQTMQKVQDDQKFRQLLALNPRPTGDDPAKYEQWLRRMSGLSAEAGLTDHAQVFSKMIGEVRPEKIETDLKTMKDGSTVLINKQTGETIKNWPAGEMPDLNPEQRAQLTLSYRKEYENQIAQPKSALESYKAYNSSSWGGANDALKLANAIKVIVPTASVSAEQVLSGQAAADYGAIPIIGPLLKAFSEKGGKEMDLAGRTAIDAYVQGQIPNVTANARSILSQHRSLAQSVGLDPNQTTYDPTSGESSLIPVPSAIRTRANKIRRINGQKEQ